MSSEEERPRSWRTDPESTSASGGHIPPDIAARDPLWDPLTAPLPSELDQRAQEAGPAPPPRRPARERGFFTERRPGPAASAEPDAAWGSPGAERSARVSTPVPGESLDTEGLGDEWGDATPYRGRPGVTPFPPDPATGPRRQATPVPGRRRGPVRRVKRTLRHINPFSVLKLSLFYYTCFLGVWLLIVAILYGLVDATGVFDSIEELASAFGEEVTVISLGLVEKWALIIGVTLVLVGSVVNLFLAFLYNLAADILGGIEMTFQERDL